MTAVRAAGDVVGVALVAMLLGWIAFAASRTGGDAGPVVAFGLGAVAAYGVGRLLARWRWWIPPALVAAAAGLLPLLPVTAVAGTVASGIAYGPLGYANASGAWYVQAAAAGAMLAVPGGSWVRRLAGGGVVVAAGLATWWSGSQAAIALLVVALAVAALRARWAAIVGGLVVLGVIAGTVVLGATWEGRADDPAARLLTERRLDLWAEALDLTADAPLFGVGPGRFVDQAPTAVEDRDAVATHNDYLQTAAESGLPAAVLLVAVVIWAFVVLGTAGAGYRGAAAGAVAALATHAAVDYVAHAPAVLMAAAVLLGAGATRARR